MPEKAKRALSSVNQWVRGRDPRRQREKAGVASVASRTRRATVAGGPRVRIHLPPAESQQTFGSARERLDFDRRLKVGEIGQAGEYNFAGRYQQSPAPLGGGLVNAEWFVFRANEPTAHRTYAHYILTQGALGSPLAPGRPALTGVSGF